MTADFRKTSESKRLSFQILLETSDMLKRMRCKPRQRQLVANPRFIGFSHEAVISIVINCSLLEK